MKTSPFLRYFAVTFNNQNEEGAKLLQNTGSMILEIEGGPEVNSQKGLICRRLDWCGIPAIKRLL